MNYVMNLTDDRVGDKGTAGGKAASLNRLLRLGHVVPPGLVVSSGALVSFLVSNRIYDTLEEQLSGVEEFGLAEIQETSDRVRRVVLESKIPVEVVAELNEGLSQVEADAFAVRSSGGFEDGTMASWAGQFDSFLRVKRADIPARLKECWASLFGWRAIQYNPGAYRDLRGLQFAVIVQRFVEARVSGVAFSVDPGSENAKHVLIEAVPGLGDDLVQGRVTPFSVTMDKEEGIILRMSMPDGRNEPLLNPAELKELCELAREIECSFGKPIDLEWSADHGGVKVLQARPITGLARRTETSPRAGQEPDILDYELTFKVSGLSFLFCDVLVRGFKYLRPLFTSSGQEFRQYFPNERMEYAAREGYRWLSRRDGFSNYQAKFESYKEGVDKEFSRILLGKVRSAAETIKAFRLLAGFLRFYSRMDFQFTNLTFLYAKEDEVVRRNLDALAGFKDYARVWVNDMVIEDDSYLGRLTAQLAEELGLSEDLVEQHKISELEDSFTGAMIAENVLRERAESYTIFVKDGLFRYLRGEESQRFIGRIAETEARMAEGGLAGQVANGEGTIVRGKVRIINVNYANLDAMNRRIEEMRADEILVAEFTAPELMAACKKASAIVTDLGGMLSHAAIVSRELAIPCVVGTRHATRTLRDGELIEIDLLSGAIRSLSA